MTLARWVIASQSRAATRAVARRAPGHLVASTIRVAEDHGAWWMVVTEDADGFVLWAVRDRVVSRVERFVTLNDALSATSI